MPNFSVAPMGEFLGLLFGLGILLIARSLWFPATASGLPVEQTEGSTVTVVPPTSSHGVPRPLRMLNLRIVAAMLASGLAGAVLMLIVTTSIVVAVVFGLLVGSLPMSILTRRSARIREARIASWPDAVDDLASAVRAGMSLPDAVAALAERGPIQLRQPFATFADEFRRTGAFSSCLEMLRAELDDPTGDRVIEALRLAREVGGTELGRLLRTLSNVLREDSRARAELIARQSWSINAARLAVAAPWVTLLMLSLRPGALSCYDSVQGAIVLAIAAVMSAVAYAIMRRIGRLPQEQRSRVS